MRNRSLFLVLLFVCSLGTSEDWRRETLRIPFRFDARNAAENPVEKTVLLDKGTESNAAGKALLVALQKLQYSVMNLPKGDTGELKPRVTYTTDLVPVGDDAIKEHNSQVPVLQLPADRYFAVRYGVSFNVQQREAVFNISSYLYERAARSSDWSPYRKTYSGEFFARALLASVQEAFKQQSRAPVSQ
jgi:hypothetical protein